MVGALQATADQWPLNVRAVHKKMQIYGLVPEPLVHATRFVGGIQVSFPHSTSNIHLLDCVEQFESAQVGLCSIVPVFSAISLLPFLNGFVWTFIWIDCVDGFCLILPGLRTLETFFYAQFRCFETFLNWEFIVCCRSRPREGQTDYASAQQLLQQ